MTITKNQTDYLRPGDVVEVTDTEWPEGTKIVGQLVQNENGSLRFGVVDSNMGLNRITVRRGDGDPTEHAATRTLKAVKLVQPTTSINVPAVEELAMWLGREWGKKLAGMPSEWNQGLWIGPRFVDTEDGGTGLCGTTACAAGHVALANGARFAVLSEGTYPGEATMDDAEQVIYPADLASLNIDPLDLPNRINFDRIVTPDGEMMTVSRYASGVLGINDYEREMLFAGSNEFDQMMEIIGQILKRAKDETAPRVLPEPQPEPEPESGPWISTPQPQPEPGIAEWESGKGYPRGARVTFRGDVYESKAERCNGNGDPVQHAACWMMVEPEPEPNMDALYMYEGTAYVVREDNEVRVTAHSRREWPLNSAGTLARCCFRPATDAEISAGRRLTAPEMSTIF